MDAVSVWASRRHFQKVTQKVRVCICLWVCVNGINSFRSSPARHGTWGWTTRALLDPWWAAVWHISILAFNLPRKKKKKDSRISKCHCLILRSSLRKLPILLSASNCKIPSVQEGQRKRESLARGPGVFLQDRQTLRAQKKPTCHTELQKILSFFF